MTHPLLPPITIKALGTIWWIELFTPFTDNERQSVTTALTETLQSIEARFSRFLPDSLVSTLNRERSITTTDTDLQTLLTAAQTWHEATAGVFNILIGDALLARGYDAQYSFTDTNHPVTIGNPTTDIIMTSHQITLQNGTIDLGGIGKGWAIDQLANQLYSLGYTNFLINGGGDMYGTSDNGTPIRLVLEHPTIPNTYIGTTTIHHQGFAASSPHRRRWKTASGVTNHLVSDTPPLDASFVIASTAMTADILATCALLMTPTHFDQLRIEHQAEAATFSILTSRMGRSHGFPYQPVA